MIIRGSTVVDLLNAVAPLYLTIAMGYASTKLRVLPFETCFVGIGGFAGKFAVPFLVFRLVAASDPYSMNVELIQADVFSKAMILIPLVVGCVRLGRGPSPRYLMWASSSFNLAAMSNSVLVGIPLLGALYPDQVKFLTTLILLQVMLWLNVCILLLEIYMAVSENAAAAAQAAGDTVAPRSTRPSSVSATDALEFAETLARKSTERRQTAPRRSSMSATDAAELARKSTERKQTAPRRSSVSDAGTLDAAADLELAEIQARKSVEMALGHGLAPDHRLSFTVKEVRGDEPGEFVTLARQQQAIGGVQSQVPSRRYAVVPEEGVVATRRKRRIAVDIAFVVLQNFLWNPTVWASMLGLVYALINFKFNNGKPLPISVRSTIDLMADCGLGLCMFMAGMQIGVSKKLLACGIPQVLFGAGCRFIVAPATMAVASLTVGLRGDMFRFSVMQAVLPQAVITFALATQYNVHVDLFSTAVWLQTFTFLPFAIGLNALLQL